MTLKTLNYQINKTIGFKLFDEWNRLKDVLEDKKNKLDLQQDNLSYLKKLFDFLNDFFIKNKKKSNFRKLFFSNLEENKLYNFEIDKKFFYNQKLFSGKTRYANLRISKIGFSKFRDYILNLENNFLNYSNELKNFISNYEAGLFVKQNKIRNLLRNLNLFFNDLNFLLKAIDLTLLNEDIKNLINFSINSVSNILEYLSNNPFENSNVLFKFSFNYYTLNKKPYNFKFGNKIDFLESNSNIENYYKILKLKIERELSKNIEELKLFNKKYSGLFNLIKKYDSNFNEYLSLRDLKIFLKQFKSKIKSDFKKNLNNGDFKQLNDKNSFFFIEDNFKKEKFIDLIQQINNLRDIINKNDKQKEELNKFKKKKGEYFSKKIEAFSNYILLNDFYQKVARKEGQIKAQLNGLEREKQEFLSLKYWTFVLEDSKNKYLLLIDKYQRKNFKKFLKDKENNKQENFYKLYEFKSLTLKALEKLIFNNYNDNFYFKIIKEEAIKNFLKSFDIKNRFDIKEKITKEKDLIDFYKLVLTTKHAQNVLDLENFKLEEIFNKQFEYLLDFKINLEKRCFYLKEFYLTKEDLEYIKTNFNSFLFRIYSFDVKNYHFKIWQNFWNNPYDFIRLNPEGKVLYKFYSKEEKNDILNYKKQLEEQGKKFIRNRFLENNLIVYFNFSLNFPANEIKKSFKDTKELLNSIENFNKEFLKLNNDLNNLSFLSIDIGQLELATLAIVKFNNFNRNDFVLQKIEAFRLKKEFLNKDYIKNISYLFSNFNKYFEKLEVDYIDLSKAKLINGKIILNGDILTYLKIKEISAKRKIFNLVFKGRYLSDSKINFSSGNELGKNIFYITQKSKHQPLLRIYFYDLEFENIKSKSEIEKNLNDYFEYLLENKAQQEEINNLRKALAANIVGIVSYLQDKYNSFIVLENLTEEERNWHFENENFVIDSEIDWAIYNKTQTKLLAPPNISNFKSLKDLLKQEKKEKSSFFQLGSIIFIPEEKSSRICPYCEYEYDKSTFNKMKFELRKLICTKCKKENHPDLVACINLSKKAFDFWFKNLLIK